MAMHIHRAMQGQSRDNVAISIWAIVTLHIKSNVRNGGTLAHLFLSMQASTLQRQSALLWTVVAKHATDGHDHPANKFATKSGQHETVSLFQYP
jgi:hypothetical protein